MLSGYHVIIDVVNFFVSKQVLLNDKVKIVIIIILFTFKLFKCNF